MNPTNENEALNETCCGGEVVQQPTQQRRTKRSLTMPFEEWLEGIRFYEISPTQAVKDMGITYQALYKWRKNRVVTRSGVLFLQNLRNGISREEIIAERTKEYGEFRDVMERIGKYKDGLKVTFEAREGRSPIVLEAIEFVRYMLALKMARGLSPTIGYRRLQDTIADFINYYNLLDNFLAENCISHSIEFAKPYTLSDVESIEFYLNGVDVKTGERVAILNEREGGR